MGFTVLAFDFRGHGASEGREDFAALAMDLAPALAYLQGMGFERIVCMGSSMGGTACLETALTYEFAGLVLISTPMNIGIQGSPNGKTWNPSRSPNWSSRLRTI